jgi:hypothetical protein
MSETKLTKEYSFEDRHTCKSYWTFELEKVAGMWIIQSLQIDEREQPIGCEGHPKTLMALLKNRPVNSIDVNALSDSYCEKDISCSQVLAKCITQLKEDFCD